MPVVWAEDVEGDQVLIRAAIEAGPHTPRIRWARDGAEAVAAALRQHPRLIVLDVNMPNVNGVEALRRIKAKPDLRDVPVVMFSTAHRDDEVAACQDLGAVAFVQKPMDFNDFTKAVQGILDLAEQRSNPAER